MVHPELKKYDLLKCLIYLYILFRPQAKPLLNYADLKFRCFVITKLIHRGVPIITPVAVAVLQ